MKKWIIIGVVVLRGNYITRNRYSGIPRRTLTLLPGPTQLTPANKAGALLRFAVSGGPNYSV